MEIGEIRDKLIEERIALISESMIDGPTKQGCLEGLEVAKTLNVPLAFYKELESRKSIELGLLASDSRDDYVRCRYAILQIEFVYDVMRICWAQVGYVPAPTFNKVAHDTFLRISGIGKKEDSVRIITASPRIRPG
jgi:hypothetical protein